MFPQIITQVLTHEHLLTVWSHNPASHPPRSREWFQQHCKAERAIPFHDDYEEFSWINSWSRIFIRRPHETRGRARAADRSGRSPARHRSRLSPSHSVHRGLFPNTQTYPCLMKPNCAGLVVSAASNAIWTFLHKNAPTALALAILEPRHLQCPRSRRSRSSVTKATCSNRRFR